MWADVCAGKAEDPPHRPDMYIPHMLGEIFIRLHHPGLSGRAEADCDTKPTDSQSITVMLTWRVPSSTPAIQSLGLRSANRVADSAPTPGVGSCVQDTIS